MTKTPQTDYRIFDLPGIGQIKAPAHMTEAQLLAALQDRDAPDTAKPGNS